VVERKPWMEFRSSDGLEILVGRSARENDHLTFRVGGQNDFWLHVAATPGSHVVVRNPSNLARPPRATLEEAAQLAAWYSKSRAGGRVAVHWTQRRNVSKDRGAPAGEVQLRSYQSIQVTPRIPPGVFALDDPE
jgi:predicted ribosome quality control (RQC) complex YloA/Tae2 family protein